MGNGQLANAEMERMAGLLVADLTAKGLLDYTPESLFGIDQVLANYGHSKGNNGPEGLVGRGFSRDMAGAGSTGLSP